MKKILRTFICAILLVVMAVSMAACSDDVTQKKLDDLSIRINRQQEMIEQLEETIKQQKEKDEELERHNSALVEANQKLQASVTRLENSLPYKVVATAKTNSVWNKHASSYVINTQASLQQLLDELDVEFASIYDTDGWSLRMDDGTVITKELFYELYLYYNNKALVVSIFQSPCMGTTINKNYLWKDADTLHVEIDYTYGISSAIETVMVIMEVDRGYVAGVNEVVLDLN